MDDFMRASVQAGQEAATRLSVVYRQIAALKADPRNPRVHGKQQIRQIGRSITAFGFNVPVLVDAEGNIVAGHGRVMAAKALGWTEVPTIALDHLDEAQRRAFMIADNRLTETSVWDDRLLAEQLQALSCLNLDFTLEATGFEIGEIDLRIESLSPPTAEADDPADIVPSTEPSAAISRPGDLWLLGRHRLLCGDARDPAAYERLMDGALAEMVFSDPPYNVPIDGHVSGLGRVHHRDFAMASGKMSEAEFGEFLSRTCGNLVRHSADGAIHFLCMDWRQVDNLLTVGRRHYSELKNICVWAKPNAGMGSFYRSQHEFILVFKLGHGAHRNNIQLGRFGRNRSNLWHYPSPSSFGRGSEEGNLAAFHPTVKPVTLVADALLDCSARSAVVLDAFLGSGTTLIAAERGGRFCHGVEIDPLCVDTAIRR